MKKTLKLRGLIALIIVLCITVFAFASCDDNPPPEDEVLKDGVLTLIAEGKVNFQVVKTTKLGADGVKKVSTFTSQLKSLGLDVSDAVADNDAAAVKDCEIIIGTGAQNRGDECNIDYHSLGDNGYVIKVVDKRVIIAGGSDAALIEAVDKFCSEVLGITGSTSSLSAATVTMKADKVYKRDTEYDVTDIRVGESGISLDKYYLSYDKTSTTIGTLANTVRNDIYKVSGIWLPLEHEAAEGTSIGYRFIIRLVDDAGEGAFRAYVDDDDNYIVECSFESGFTKGTEAFLDEYIRGEDGVVRFYADEVFEYPVNVVRYTDFGAKGDGKTDDTLAILKTHEAANASGMKVIEDAGLTYYIGEASYGIEIPVQTDVDFGNAKFIIDDTKLKPDVVYGNTLGRSYAIFAIEPSAECKAYAVDKSVYQNISIDKDAVNESGNIGMTFDTDVMLSLGYKGQKIYIRWGSNANNGGDTHEMVIVDKDGNLDPTTPMTYDYPTIDYLYAYSIEEEPITISGGTFTTWACQPCYSFTNSSYVTGDQYYYYNRALEITRSHVTVKDMKHYVEKESNEGYPYNGWFNVSSCYDTLIENCIVTGRKAYIEDRDTDGDGQPNENAGTTMGSYDLIGSSAIDIKFKDVKQSNSITSNYYWGIMGSNYCRNITYDGCYLSRFDAHCGVYNAYLIDTTIGFDINLIGHGEVLIENVTKMVGSDIVSLRLDYGSTWNGTITVKNMTMYGYGSNQMKECTERLADPNFAVVAGTWTDHEFGNDCNLPNIIVDGFSVEGAGSTSVSLSFYRYSSLTVDAFNPAHKNYLALPEFVELRSIDAGISVYYTHVDTNKILGTYFTDGTIEDRTTGETKIKNRY